MPRLDGNDFKILRDLIIEAIDSNDLKELARFQMGITLGNEVYTEQRYKTVVFELIQDLEQKGTVVELIDAVLVARPNRLDIQQEFARIRHTLGAPSHSSSDLVNQLKTSLDKISNSLGVSSVKVILSSSYNLIDGLAKTISRLHTYKSLHDVLHNTQMQYSGLARAARNPAVSGKELRDILNQLRAYRDQAEYEASKLDPAPLKEGEMEWINRFTEALTLGLEARARKDDELGRQCGQEFKRLLRYQAPRIDGIIRAATASLRLDQLKDVFRQLAEAQGLDDSFKRSFANSPAFTEQLLTRLGANVSQHNAWQDIDISLWDGDDEIPKVAGADPSDFNALWTGIKKRLFKLTNSEPNSEWAIELTQGSEIIDAFQRAENWEDLRSEFHQFRAAARFRFYKVDTTLKSLVEEVEKIGLALRNLLTQL